MWAHQISMDHTFVIIIPSVRKSSKKYSSKRRYWPVPSFEQFGDFLRYHIVIDGCFTANRLPAIHYILSYNRQQFVAPVLDDRPNNVKVLPQSFAVVGHPLRYKVVQVAPLLPHVFDQRRHLHLSVVQADHCLTRPFFSYHLAVG